MVAQETLSQLQSQSTNLAARNKAVLEGIEREGNVKKNFLVSELAKEKASLEKVVKETKDTLDTLSTKAEALEISNTKLSEENERLETSNRSINRQLQAATEMLVNLGEEKVQKEQELQGIRVDIGRARTELSEVNESKDILIEDKALLSTELGTLQDKIVETDSQLVAHTQAADKKQIEVDGRLQRSINMLRETQQKDEDIRKSWQVQLADLERRESVVKKRELKAGDVESRVQEYENYMRL